MVREHLPQQGKDALVGEDRFPGRLDPARRRFCKPLAERIARMLEPDGVLALGAAESVVGITDAFKPYPERRGLYRANVAPAARPGVSTMAPQTLKAVASAR